MLPLLVASALLFDFLNGFKDSANMVATVIASRALAPRAALVLTAIPEFIGPFLFGVAVARTVGAGLIDAEVVSLQVVLGGIWAAIGWNILTWYLGLPTSSSHALVGGLIGAAVMKAGWSVVQLVGVAKVLIALFISPLLGFLLGALLVRLVLFFGQAASPHINKFFKRAQVVTSAVQALSHGTNSAQKTMGIITLGLVVSGEIDSFVVPFWVIVASASAIAIGISSGGWRLIRTLGGRIYKVRPLHGFASQIASASVILGAALLGGPVSTTHVVSSAIMGAGAAERLSKVRWQVAQEMVWAWILTIPLTFIAGALAFLLLDTFT